MGGGSGGRSPVLVRDAHARAVPQIGKQQASLATNKHCSLVLEKLLRNSSHEQLKTFFRGLRGYFNFLGFNRFSTHVLETLLSLLGPVIAEEVASGTTEGKAAAPDAVPDEEGKVPSADSVCDMIHQLCNEMGDSWLTLMQTPGSTHVVRTLLAVLTGREVIARPDAAIKPRNRKKKKKRKRPVAAASGTNGRDADGSKASSAVQVGEQK